MTRGSVRSLRERDERKMRRDEGFRRG